MISSFKQIQKAFAFHHPVCTKIQLGQSFASLTITKNWTILSSSVKSLASNLYLHSYLQKQIILKSQGASHSEKTASVQVLTYHIIPSYQQKLCQLHSLPFGLNFWITRHFSSTGTSIMADNKYIVGYAKLGTSSCKKCKQKIEKGSLRIGKVTPNPFSDDGGDMKQWFHPSCIFETFVRARAATKKIEDTDDLEGFGDLQPEDKEVIKDLIESMYVVVCPAS